MPSAWITHVKQFASQHHMKYGNALKHPQCKASYHKLKGGMMPRRPDDPRPSGRRGQRPNPSEPPPVQTVANWVLPVEAEVIPISNVENEGVEIIQQIQSVQEMIQQYTNQLALNPNRTHTINILRAFQVTENTLLDQARHLTTILNANDDDLDVAEEYRIANVPYNHHIRDEDWFRENEGSDHNRIGPSVERYFRLPTEKSSSGTGIRRRKVRVKSNKYIYL